MSVISPPQRAELPDCSKLHSLALRSKFEEGSKARDYHFEEEVLDFLTNFIRDNDRKIDHAKTRLHHTQDAPENEEKVCSYDFCYWCVDIVVDLKSRLVTHACMMMLSNIT